MKIDIEKIAAEWPSPFVARTEFTNFSRGLYKSSSMNSFDGAKNGIKRRIRVNGRISYLKSDVIDWLKHRKKKESNEHF